MVCKADSKKADTVYFCTVHCRWHKKCGGQDAKYSKMQYGKSTQHTIYKFGQKVSGFTAGTVQYKKEKKV